jgi:hypothetical protein
MSLQANAFRAYGMKLIPPDIHSIPFFQPVSWPAECLVAFDIKCRPDSGFPSLSYKPSEGSHSLNNLGVLSTTEQSQYFNVIGERGALVLAKNEDDPEQTVGWIQKKDCAMFNFARFDLVSITPYT